jgi:hypothetical protein
MRAAHLVGVFPTLEVAIVVLVAFPVEPAATLRYFIRPGSDKSALDRRDRCPYLTTKLSRSKGGGVGVEHRRFVTRRCTKRISEEDVQAAFNRRAQGGRRSSINKEIREREGTSNVLSELIRLLGLVASDEALCLGSGLRFVLS